MTFREMEDFARAIVEVDGMNPDETYVPRGLKCRPIPMWEMYGLDRARRVLEIVARRKADRALSTVSGDTG